MMHRAIAGLLFSVAFLTQAMGDEPADETPKKTEPAPAKNQARLEKDFQDLMSGATLTGHYTVGGQENGALPKEEKYTISKVSKLNGDLWIFQVRIQYGDHDVAVPIPLRVKWAGDTPVITLDKVPVPGLGTFSARVLIFDGKYAGTWGAADHGGLLFGRVTPAEKDQPEKDSNQP